MALNTFEIEFKELAKDIFLRADFDYFEIKKELNIDRSKKLKNYLLYLETGKPIKPEDYEERSNNVHIVVRNIIDGQFDTEKLIFINDEKAESLEKYRITKDDIVIAISSNCGHSFYYDGSSDLNLTLSHYLARFKVNEKFVNPRFLNYYINSKKIRQYFKSVETGKTIKNLSNHYIKELPLLIPSKPIQDQIVAQIEPIEKRTKELKSQIKQPQEIINKVFAREFGFNLAKFEELKKIKFFEIDLYSINTPLIRTTVIQNSKSTNYLKYFFKNIKTIYLKNIITKKIQRGKQPEYTDEGIKVIKTANIQKGEITFNDVLQYVSRNFYLNNKEKAGIQKFDLLLTSTGMGRGKFALYDSDEEAFADSHISIIRFDIKNINPYFLKYYSQSFLGIEQLKYIEIHIKGTPEIYEEQLKFFQIPDISLKEQERIVNEIKAELDKQKEIEKEIEKERNKIDKIIEEVIK